jgi:hypothetical protein
MFVSDAVSGHDRPRLVTERRRRGFGIGPKKENDERKSILVAKRSAAFRRIGIGAATGAPET